MTNEEAIKILKHERICRVAINAINKYCVLGVKCTTCEYAEDNDDVTNAIGLAIEALSKQSASSGQADQCGNGTEMVELKKRKITERLIIAKSLIDSVIADSERVSLFKQEKSNSFSKEPSKDSESEMNCSDVPDIHVGKTDFQPGDKFILELGQERRMFGEFEIKGTDLYVKTSLLEKLTRYEPEVNATTDKVLIDLAEAIKTVKFECGEWQGLAQTIVDGLKKLPSKQPEKIPYKKPEVICCKDCRYRDPEDKKCDHGHGIVWQLPRPDDWFCADGKA